MRVLRITLATSLAALATACAAPGPGETRAALGVATSVPSEELVERMDLSLEVRVEGRLVDAVEPGSTAAAAGLAPGDVLLELDGVPLYSHDDVEDLLGVSRPGQEVALRYKRAGEREARELRLALGARPAPAVEGPRLRWELVSFARYPRALERARAEKRKVLVGLSGAET